VVASRASSLPEVLGDAALQVPGEDLDAIASAIGRVLDEPALASDLRRRGLERAASFTWERTARATVAAYEEALR
jgi:glycosyltransferase involved in cell wall biosynthesis